MTWEEFRKQQREQEEKEAALVGSEKAMREWLLGPLLKHQPSAQRPSLLSRGRPTHPPFLPPPGDHRRLLDAERAAKLAARGGAPVPADKDKKRGCQGGGPRARCGTC